MSGPTVFPRGLAAGGKGGVTTASAVLVMRGSFSSTSASQVLIGTLPLGARVVDVWSLAGATGGVNPTVDIGTLAVADGLANELDADGRSSAFNAGTVGAQWNTQFTVPTPVYGKVGASAATGGTTSVMIHYVVEA